MIKGLSHASVWVLDQDEAKAFYTEKMGFEVRDDVAMDGFRWLTVAAPDQSDLRLVLSHAGPPAMSAEDGARVRELLAKGLMSGGVLATDDCRATWRELSARGVEFLQEPAQRPYGIEAVFRDNSGNWFSLTQRWGG